jgi:hypothetical protein
VTAFDADVEAGVEGDIAAYCRGIEAFLCRKNDGHLIRVVGPSFELVSRWAERGVPFKIACQGIDRYFERYYRSGPRRRPIKIDFCEADVLDVFDEWRRATGVTQTHGDAQEQAAPSSRGPSLVEHLTRVIVKLTQARVSETLDATADPLIEALSTALDTAKRASRGLRGDAKKEMLARLAAADAEMLTRARARLSPATLGEISTEAGRELEPFRAQMTGEIFERAHARAVDRLVRERLNLPTISVD